MRECGRYYWWEGALQAGIWVRYRPVSGCVRRVFEGERSSNGMAMGRGAKIVGGTRWFRHMVSEPGAQEVLSRAPCQVE